MGKLADRLAKLTPLQRAALALKESQARLAQLERARSEPIAIVGIACRFPGGVSDTESYWRLLADGVDAVTEVPRDRWDADAFYDADPSAPGKMNTRWGGFLKGVDLFDNHFFGISDREAARIDPQQRLLLEVAWEALEDAGIPPSTLAGSPTGVFVGISVTDYGFRLSGELALTDAYVGTGTSLSIAANRISFAHGLHGPSLAIDTACSSSLVAIHEACQSIRSGESTAALAGGVNLVLSPVSAVNLTKAGFTAPDGRCRAFDADASGYVRSEGAGLVVLKPLSQALADADPIYAVIRGSAVNHDGPSNGLTAPNGKAQEAVLRAAYADAKVSPGEVQFIEAHGTGTPLGDPIEAKALGRVLAENRPPGRLCALGAVKANIGHAEAAAGVAGLIKVALCLTKRQLPGTALYKKPNPNIPFDELPLRVQQRLEDWSQAGTPALAGVSSFGFGGANAHVVLEEAPAASRETAGDAPRRDGHLIPITARTEAALRQRAQDVRDLLASNDPPDFADVAYTLARRRDHLDVRLALIASDGSEAVERLDAFLETASGRRQPPVPESTEQLPATSAEEQSLDVVTGRKPFDRAVRVVFVFSDDLAQLRSAAAALQQQEPAFAEAVDVWSQRLETETGWSLSAWLDGEDTAPDDERAGKPTRLFCLQMALVDFWKRWGVAPGGAIGLGVGDLAAACAAGALTREDALAAALRRSANGAAGLLPDPQSSPVREAEIRLVLVGSGCIEDGREMAGATWNRKESTVRAADVCAAVHQFRDRNVDVFLELGPPTWTAIIADEQASLDKPAKSAATLAGKKTSATLRAAGMLYAAGHSLDWEAIYSARRKCVRLPAYPWQRKRHWLDFEPLRSEGSVLRVMDTAAESTQQSKLPQRLASWLYEVRWVESAREPDAGRVGDPTYDAGRWLILADQSGVGEQLVGMLKEAGGEPVVVHADQLPGVLRKEEGKLTHVVHLWGLDAQSGEQHSSEDVMGAQSLGCGSLPKLLRELSRQGQSRFKLWIATRGAQQVGGDDHVDGLAQAPLWGMGRALAQESAEHWGGLIDLDPQASLVHAAEDLLREITANDSEDEIAFRAERRLVARLAPAKPPQPEAPVFRPDATYLVTGGLGGLGSEVAAWMVGEGARRLVLLGRSPLPPRSEWSQIGEDHPLRKKIDVVRRLEALGASVHLASLDVADETALRSYLQQFRAESWPPIRGVLHLAGTTALDSVMATDDETLQNVLRPKVLGGWNLHKLLAGDPLDFFVSFSSAASILSSPMLGSYAAANAFLDSLTDYRRANGLPALSVNWGSWAGLGMAERASAPDGSKATTRAVKEFSPDEGLEIFGSVLGSGTSRLVAIPYAGEDWATHPPTAIDSPLLADLVKKRTADRPVAPRPDLNVEFAAPRTDLERFMADLWTKTVGLDRVGVYDNFFELGGDSLQAAILLNRMQEHLGEVIDPLVLVESQNIHDLAAHFRKAYPAAIKRLYPSEAVVETETRESHWPEVIGPDELHQAKRLIDRLAPRETSLPQVTAKNPRAVFILSPPRSGSTLFRVMLAGHPKLFAPPELELLAFNTMQARRDAYTADAAAFLQGATRALMEARRCSTDEARAIVDRFEREAASTHDFYRAIQEAIGERILVDKTPGYAMHPEALQRAELFFEDPLYIHLLRHPCGMIRSYVDYKMYHGYAVRFNVIKDFPDQKFPFSPAQMAELVWVMNHQNILSFLENVPAERQIQLRFEDLVRQPEDELQSVCRFLGVDYDPLMAQPYEGKENRMTDGIVPEARMHGDQNFLLKHKAVDPAAAERWRESLSIDFLGPPARDVAAQLGYDLEDLAAPARPEGADGAEREEVHHGAGQDGAAHRDGENGSRARGAVLKHPRGNGREVTAADLDDLSDEDVDSMLAEMLAEREGGRE